ICSWPRQFLNGFVERADAFDISNGANPGQANRRLEDRHPCVSQIYRGFKSGDLPDATAPVRRQAPPHVEDPRELGRFVVEAQGHLLPARERDRAVAGALLEPKDAAQVALERFQLPFAPQIPAVEGQVIRSLAFQVNEVSKVAKGAYLSQ